MAAPAQIRRTSEYLANLMRAQLESDGYAGVTVLLDAPRREIIEQKIPALSCYLRSFDKDDDAAGANACLDGDFWNAAPVSYRLHYVVAAWANDPREEQVLLESALCALLEPQLVNLEHDSEGGRHPILLLHQLDDEGMSRFWTSLGQAQRPAIQCSTWVDVFLRQRERVARRVESTEFRFARRR